jgi:hypothetical protein
MLDTLVGWIINITTALFELSPAVGLCIVCLGLLCVIFYYLGTLDEPEYTGRRGDYRYGQKRRGRR